MGDMGEIFRDMRAETKRRKAERLAAAPAILNAAGIKFTEHNGGVHFIVRHKRYDHVDFWPSTGHWTVMKGPMRGRKGHGIQNLIKLVT